MNLQERQWRANNRRNKVDQGVLMMGKDRNWFNIRQVSDGVWCISEKMNDYIYLIAGKKRALLLDTGWGIGNLPSVVQEITSLPVIVVNSHGHPDHACGDYQFEEVYLPTDDQEILSECFRPEYRQYKYDSLIRNCGPLPTCFSLERWVNARAGRIINLQEGHRFDLGGRILSVIGIPGHTPGSIGLLDEENTLLFSGDSILLGEHVDIWLHLKQSLPLRDYLKSMQKLDKINNKFDTILASHGTVPVNKLVIKELIAGVEDIIEGRRKGESFHTFTGDGLRMVLSNCSLIYNEVRI
jgi:glyoxylase-like metal-dependent hydrolase (beta-lactamase superfamily II)